MSVENYVMVESEDDSDHISPHIGAVGKIINFVLLAFSGLGLPKKKQFSITEFSEKIFEIIYEYL